MCYYYSPVCCLLSNPSNHIENTSTFHTTRKTTKHYSVDGESQISSDASIEIENEIEKYEKQVEIKRIQNSFCLIINPANPCRKDNGLKLKQLSLSYIKRIDYGNKKEKIKK